MTTLDTVLTILDDVTTTANEETPTMDATPTITVEAPAMDTEAVKADPKFAHVPLTPELLVALRTAAGDKPMGPFVAQLLADKYGVVLPTTDGRKKYNTDEERETAKVAAKDKAANLRKGLLMAHRARMANDAVKLAEAELIIAANS